MPDKRVGPHFKHVVVEAAEGVRRRRHATSLGRAQGLRKVALSVDEVSVTNDGLGEGLGLFVVGLPRDSELGTSLVVKGAGACRTVRRQCKRHAVEPLSRSHGPPKGADDPVADRAELSGHPALHLADQVCLCQAVLVKLLYQALFVFGQPVFDHAAHGGIEDADVAASLRPEAKGWRTGDDVLRGVDSRRLDDPAKIPHERQRLDVPDNAVDLVGVAQHILHVLDDVCVLVGPRLRVNLLQRTRHVTCGIDLLKEAVVSSEVVEQDAFDVLSLEARHVLATDGVREPAA